MHKFAVIHKPSSTLCYSANNVSHCVAPNDNYQIVSLDSTNASKFTTVACDLSFNDYAEIAAALNGDFIGFHTDENDNLSISNESRTVVIPALLFNELCLEVEEVAFGDVCESVGDDESLAYEATHLWVASRLLANTTTNNATNNTAQDTTVNTVKKFTLKFEGFNTTRPGAFCSAENFASVLHSDHYSVEQAKTMLISHFIAAQNEIARENNNPEQIWSYNVNTKSNTTTIYAAPEINFLPLEGDLEAMQAALTSAKVGATFFDVQIGKHLESVGIKTTRANIRVYRKSYIAQISKMLIEEILTKRSTATVVRWFDCTNGNSYFSVRLSSGQFAINVPLAYGYGDAENLVIRALRLELPRTMRAREVLERNGVTVVDLGYKAKGELYKAAFHI